MLTNWLLASILIGMIFVAFVIRSKKEGVRKNVYILLFPVGLALAVYPSLFIQSEWVIYTTNSLAVIVTGVGVYLSYRTRKRKEEPKPEKKH